MKVMISIKNNTMCKLIKPIFTLLILMLSVLMGCNNSALFSDSKALNNESWKRNDTLQFDVNVDNTISAYNFYILIRNTTEYRYSNFFIFINTVFPDKKIACDTLECILADEKGKWYGKGTGRLKDNKILFRRLMRFQQKGKYSMRLSHGMREQTITGIADIGLMIQKN